MATANNMADARNVFLVDDGSSLVNLYSTRLEQAGFKTTSAFDTQEVCDALPDVCADLIILDLMLPERGGMDVLHAIRANSRHKDTPVLILSNAYLPEMGQKALRAGGNKVLLRSECTSADLISASRELVGIAEANDASESANASVGWSTATSLTEQLEKDFLDEGRAELAAIRQNCSRYVELAGSEAGNAHLTGVYQSIRVLSTRSGLAGCWKVAQLTGAIEAMLFDRLSGANTGMSPSSIQTLAKAVDCLDRLFTSGNTGSGESSCTARVLLVDDDLVCNMANSMALNGLATRPSLLRAVAQLSRCSATTPSTLSSSI